MSRLIRIIDERAPEPTFLQRIVMGVRSFWSGPLTLKSPEIARQLGWFGGPTASGVPVTEANALTYAAVWSAVSLLSSQISMLPLVTYRRQANGGKERAVNLPLYELLHDTPNPEMSSMTMRETMTAHCLTWGNAYCEIERDQLGRPLNLWPLLPNQVDPYRDQAKQLQYLVRTPGAPDVVIPAADMLHICGLGFDGLKGYSPIWMARESLGLGLAMQKFGATFFGNGSTFGGVLQHPKTIGETAQKNLRESIEARHTGVERAHRFLMLEEGMTYQKLGIDPDSAQFIESRKFEIAEVARWFNVPPHKLRDLTDATFSNIEQQNIEFVVDSVLPWCRRWESEIRRKLLSRAERQTLVVEHLVDGLMRGDSAARHAYYTAQFQIGAMTINEIRAAENRNPIGPEGDQVFILSTMSTPKQVTERPAADPIAEPLPARALIEIETPESRAEREREARLTANQEQHRAHLRTLAARQRQERVQREIADQQAAAKAEAERRQWRWDFEQKVMDRMRRRRAEEQKLIA